MKHCGQLYPWIQSLSNHLWWVTQTCNSDAQLLVEQSKSIVHHISNVYEWDNDPAALFPKYVHPCSGISDVKSQKTAMYHGARIS